MVSSTERVSTPVESRTIESVPVVSDMACSAVDVSFNLLSIRESAMFRMLIALPASMPNDCIAATSTNRVGTHIFAIKRFIQDGKGTDFFLIFAIIYL